jgi:threonine aldolase
MFNKEAAIFFLTASMANLAAVLLHTKPGSEVIISSTSHSVERESASFARIAGVQLRQISTESGLMSQQQSTTLSIKSAKESEKARSMSLFQILTSSS